MFKETKDVTTPVVEEMVVEFRQGKYCGVAPDNWNDDHFDGYKMAQKEIESWLRTTLTDYGDACFEEGVKHGAQQERKFIENILDGIEEAERLEGEPFSTNTIRFALKNRII